MIQSRKLKMQKVNLVSTTRIALLISALSCTIISCGKTEAPKEQADATETQHVAAVEEAPTESLNDIMKRLGIDKKFVWKMATRLQAIPNKQKLLLCSLTPWCAATHKS